METSRTALQLARVVVLVTLLLATGWSSASSGPPESVRDIWAPWVATSLITILFVAVMLVGRRRHHPRVVLTVEAVIATVLAFVPPTLWILWFGLYDWTLTLVAGYGTPLAMAWLGVVVARGVYQHRDAGPARSRPATEDAALS